MTLQDLIESTCWDDPAKKMMVVLSNPDFKYRENVEEFEGIDLNVKTILRYKDYVVSDIDIEDDALYCFITKPVSFSNCINVVGQKF